MVRRAARVAALLLPGRFGCGWFCLSGWFRSSSRGRHAQHRFLQRLGGSEAQPCTRRNLDLFAGGGIAPDSRGELALAENAQARQANRAFLLRVLGRFVEFYTLRPVCARLALWRKTLRSSCVSDDFREPGMSEKTTHENTMAAASFVRVPRTRKPIG